MPLFRHLLLALLFGASAVAAAQGGPGNHLPSCDSRTPVPPDAAELTVAVDPSPVASGDTLTVTYTLRNTGRGLLSGCLSREEHGRLAVTVGDEEFDIFVMVTHPLPCSPFAVPPETSLTWTKIWPFTDEPRIAGTREAVGLVDLNEDCYGDEELRSAPIAIAFLPPQL